MEAERPRIATPLVLSSLTAAVVLALCGSFSAGGLREHIVETSAPSELTVAYLEAWLRTQPQDSTFLSALALQYLRLGRNDDAERVAARMDGVGTASMHAHAALVRLKVAEQRAFADADDSPARATDLARARDTLKAALVLPWEVASLRDFASDALAIGAPDLATACYQRLATQDGTRRALWSRKAGEQALASGDYRQAAAAFFDAQAASTDSEDVRRDFLSGVVALQSGNLLDEALEAAKTHAGDLEHDHSTLLVLLALARAAHRPELVDRYAQALMKVSNLSEPDEGAPRDASYRPEAEAMPFPAKPLYLDGPSPRSTVFRGRVGILRVGTQAGAASGARKDDVPSLLYQSFVESNDLENAQRIASEQVQRQPKSAVWQKRLAQVAEWHRDGATSLKAWLAYAELSNDPQGWQNVQRIAPMLDDDEAYLKALVHASDAAPGDLALVDQALAAYERLGRPQDGLAFLKSRALRGDNAQIAARYAALAERAGLSSDALDTYRSLQQIDPRNTQYAIGAANLLYQQGNYTAALAALKVAAPYADKDDVPYWRTYGQLARLTRDDDDANAAYRRLLATGQATPEDLAAMTYFYEPFPIDAGRTSELKYDSDHNVLSLRNAIFYYTQAHAFDHVKSLLARLTPEALQAAEARPDFLGVRAEYYRLTDQPALALQDLARATAMPNSPAELKAAYLWMLVDAGTEMDLRVALERWQGDARHASELWRPYAAALMRLNRPEAALRYLRLEAASSARDPLWMLAYADAEEMAGRPDLAWGIRRTVWRGLLAWQNTPSPVPARARSKGLMLPVRSETEDHAELEGRRMSLAEQFSNGDVANRLLDDLMRTSTSTVADDPAAQRSMLGEAQGTPRLPTNAEALAAQSRVRASAARDVAIAWALSQESNPLAKRWLARRYASLLLAPADAQLSVALADGDTAAMNRLLEVRTASLSLDNRIDASIETDHPGAAETLAFNGLDGAPQSDDLHQRLVETSTFWGPSIGGSVDYYVEHPLDYLQQSLAGSYKLSDHYLIGAKEALLFQHSTDSTQLTDIPHVDQAYQVFVRRLTEGTDIDVGGGRRIALDSFYTANASGEFGRNSNLTVKGSIGYNQMATEDPVLQVGAMKDNITGNVVWNITQRLSVTAEVEGDRFYSQAGHFLGTGVLSQGEIAYKFRLDYPDFTLRFIGVRGNYNASGTPDSLLERIVPGAPTNASAYMPPTYTQYGALFSFGQEISENYTHAWRPYLDVGAVHDSVQGWGAQVDVGVAGSVFGGDHAAIYLQHESVSERGTSVTVYGVRYSKFF